MNDDVRRAVVRSAESARIQSAVVATQTAYVPALVLQMFIVTLGQLVVGALSGSVARPVASLRALLSLPANISRLRERRARIAALRVISDAEVRALQVRGSARLSAYLRKRAREAGRAEASSVTREGDEFISQRGTISLWLALVGAVIIGGRSLIAHGSITIGQFASLPGGPRQLLSMYQSGWWVAGFGKAASAPTGIALSAVASIVSLGRTGLLHTAAIIGLPFVGYIGMWQFASVLSTRRARITATVAYAVVPLPYAAMSIGRWGVLVVYASLPWCAHFATRIVGHRPVTVSEAADADDHFIDHDPRTFVRRFAWFGLALGTAFAFEPSIVVVLAELSVVWALVTWLYGARPAIAVRWIAVPLAAVGIALLLNAPWLPSFAHRQWWSALVGAPVDGERNLGLVSLLSFDFGRLHVSSFAILLVVPAAVSLVVVRGNRAPWALRGSLLSVVALLVAVLDDRAMLPAHLPEPGVMLVPFAFGLAVSIGALGASLTVDVRGARFGWRRPLGFIATVALVVGALPAAISVLDGRWNQPTSSLADLLQQLPSASDGGNYRTLFLGDARVLPASAVHVGWGIGYSVIDNRTITTADQWMPPASRATVAAEDAIRGIARGSTARAGRLLAPLAVRFIVVPVIDGAASTRSNPIEPPRNLVSALDDQLDLRRRYSSPDLVIYENAAWIPIRSQLTDVGAEASKLAGATAMIASDINGASPLFPSRRADVGGRSTVQPGVVHLAIPFSTGWRLKVDGAPVAPRTAFGITQAYDITTGGTAVLTYESSMIGFLVIVVQAMLWLALLVLAVWTKRIVLRDAPVTHDGAVMSFREAQS